MCKVSRHIHVFIMQGYKVHGGQQQVVRIQKDFTVAAHFSEKAERSLWEQESTFPDQILLDRCLCTRFYCRAGSCSWPLVFDQYSQFKGYLEALEKQSITASQLESTRLNMLNKCIVAYMY